MIPLGNLLISVAGMLHWIIFIFYWLLLAHVILSWVSPDPRNPIVQFIYSTTEPVLSKVRGKIPPIGMIDISPIAVFLFLYFLDSFLVRSLADYGQYFRGSAAAPAGF